MKPFHEQPLEVREGILKWWLSPASYLPFPPARAFAVGVMQLTKMLWLRRVTEDLYPAIGYDNGVGRVNAWSRDDAWKQKAPEILQGEERGFYDQWNFVQINEPTELEADVVIVGSGCGGAVAAKIIAEAGFRVIVVEKGTWVPANQLPLSDVDATEQLFEGGLTATTEDGSVGIMAGSTFGGGGVVNWSASLRTPHYVRQEWAENHKLPFFLTPDFDRHLNNVWTRMGVQTPTTHNNRNQAVLSGSQKLGYNACVVPQNASPEHQDPRCSNGCGCPPGARKTGTVHTYLPDASRAGARFITSFQCKTLLFSKENSNQVIGIQGVYGRTETQVIIKAREVVVSAGTINTPALLINSGLKSPHIGANLHIHPAIVMYATYSHPRDPIVGSGLTTLVQSFDNLDNRGHGVRLEAPIMNPGIILGTFPWCSGQQFKDDIACFQNMDSYIGIVRDEATGRVVVDEAGRPRLHYSPGAKERQWALTGVEAIAKIALVEGAEKIFAPIQGFPPFVRTGECKLGVLDPGFQAWLSEVRKVGLQGPGAMFGSAHQMGSCRMGATPRDGVVDENGRVWGVEGVSVADASVLPSAAGVNPMVTVMAVAEHVAEGVVERLRKAPPARL